MHADLPPSAWVERFAPLIAADGKVLDLACGSGRHARLLAAAGYRVEAVDRNAESLAALAGIANITARLADLEGAPWPYAAGVFDGIVVVNYLFRPRFGDVMQALKPGGVLIYETFMAGNEKFGKPASPEFLLRPAELLERVGPTMTVVAFEQGQVTRPRPAVVQRLCAVASETLPAIP